MYSGAAGKYRSEEARKARECPACHGLGRKRYSTYTCPRCGGTGELATLVPGATSLTVCERVDDDIERAILEQLRRDAALEIPANACQSEIVDTIRRRDEAQLELARRTGRPTPIIRELLECGMISAAELQQEGIEAGETPAVQVGQGEQSPTGLAGRMPQLFKFLLVILLPLLLVLLALVVFRPSDQPNERRIENHESNR